MIKIDLSSGFFQIPLAPQHRRFHGVCYRGQQLALTRLPMGHPLAPYVLQRLAQAVAQHINQRFGTAMVAYLDDWLLFQPHLPPRAIVQEIRHLGFTINMAKSILDPTSSLIYLGLRINATTQQLQPTPECLQHIMQLASLVPDASPLDLRRITGYISWLAWAMNWPFWPLTYCSEKHTGSHGPSIEGSFIAQAPWELCGVRSRYTPTPPLHHSAYMWPQFLFSRYSSSSPTASPSPALRLRQPCSRSTGSAHVCSILSTSLWQRTQRWPTTHSPREKVIQLDTIFGCKLCTPHGFQ